MKTKETKSKPVLVTIAEYVRRVKKTKEGKNCTPQTIHARKNRGALEFVIGGKTPEYKIDIRKYPPDKFKKEPRGRRSN